MANKYLDGAGLDHMWDKVKSYLVSNYAAKSHTHTIAQITNLQTTLNGKANSSHTHTINQITDLSSSGFLKVNNLAMQNYGTIDSGGSVTRTYTIPAMNVNSVTAFCVKATAKDDWRGADTSLTVVVKAPSGGQYVTEGGVVVSGRGTIVKKTVVSYGVDDDSITDLFIGGLLIRLS